MNFRPATRTDLITVMTWIDNAESCLTWAGPQVRFPLDLEQAYQAIEFDITPTYALDDGNQLLAFGQIRMFENNRGHLARIVVNPATRGQGIGRFFTKALIAEAKNRNCQTISLKVDKDNEVAISLYESLGFAATSPQPENLRDDVVYMELS